jgi:DNA polymerase-3 subunit delta'
MGFESVIGHEAIKTQIQNSIAQGKFSHAHLIIGEDGLGKSLIAKGIALKILGKEIDRTYVDIIEWRVDKNRQSIGVDDIRVIIKEVNKKPYEGDKKVVIVYEADKMTTEAQNAFLKTIEEPPKGVTMILLCQNSKFILETIKSRCQIHRLKRLNFEEMGRYIKREYPDLDDDMIKQVINFCEGIPGRSKLFLENETFKNIRNITMEILVLLNKKEKYIVKTYEEFFNKYKEWWEEILNCFVSYIRDAILYKETGKYDVIINGDKIEEIKGLSNIYSFKELSKIIDIINDAREKIERKVNLVLAFDMMLLKMQEV